jgi:arylsulfatase A-like enzyme
MWCCTITTAGARKVVDDGMANLTAALRASGRWEDTLLWVSSDNGCVSHGRWNHSEFQTPPRIFCTEKNRFCFYKQNTKRRLSDSTVYG